MHDFLSALSLAAVIDGLVLFVAPLAWKYLVEQLLDLYDSQLRVFGGVIVAIGLLALWWIRY